MKQNTGSPTLAPSARVLPTEPAALDLLREEWTLLDPTTGRVLSTVDAYDEEAYALLLQDEEWAKRPDALAYAPLQPSDHPSGLSSAARQSLGLFVVAAIEDDLRARSAA